MLEAQQMLHGMTSMLRPHARVPPDCIGSMQM